MGSVTLHSLSAIEDIKKASKEEAFEFCVQRLVGYSTLVIPPDTMNFMASAGLMSMG